MNYMRKQHILFTFFILMALVSCGLNAHYADGYIHTESVQRAICKSISGDVKSKLFIFYADTSAHWKPSKESTGYTRAVVKDSILNYAYTIGDYGNQYVVFPHFPISLLGRVMSDTALAHALSNVGPKEIVMKYIISGNGSSDDHKGLLSFHPQPLFLTLQYGGKSHLVSIYFDDNTCSYMIDADNIQPMKVRMQVSVASIKVDDVTVQTFDDWEKNESEFWFIVLPE